MAEDGNHAHEAGPIASIRLPVFARDDALARALAAIAAASDPSAATAMFCRGVFPESPLVRVLSIGKAGVTMMRAGLGVMGARVSAGLVVAPEESARGFTSEARTFPGGAAGSVRVLASDHPLPTARSEAAADEALRFVAEGDEPLVVLLSGGGSAMVAKPVEGVSLEDLRGVADALMRSGATIDELNTVRKHLDRAKGGRLGVASRGRPVAVGVVSDVLGDRLDVISSGPFAADPSTLADAAAVLRRHAVRVPSVDSAIERAAGETPKLGDARLSSISHTVLASNGLVARSAAESLRSDPELCEAGIELHEGVAGDARSWGERVADRLRGGRGAVVLGGESVVSDVPAGSVGGPVQEAVLTAGDALRGVRGWAVLGIATDGIDGPTDAAGAVLTGRALPAAEACARAMASHDSHPLLDSAGALLRTGPTGTNLNDILIGIRR
ncbi:MAG: DUF4147 domain-containing protein [Planctomycetota bacterium]